MLAVGIVIGLIVLAPVFMGVNYGFIKLRDRFIPRRRLKLMEDLELVADGKEVAMNEVDDSTKNNGPAESVAVDKREVPLEDNKESTSASAPSDSDSGSEPGAICFH